MNLDDGDKEPWIIFTMCEDKRYISGAIVQRIRSALTCESPHQLDYARTLASSTVTAAGFV